MPAKLQRKGNRKKRKLSKQNSIEVMLANHDRLENLDHRLQAGVSLQ
jgi:hypothetical protein